MQRTTEIGREIFLPWCAGVTGISKVPTEKVTFEPGVGEYVRFYYIEKCRRTQAEETAGAKSRMV